MLSSAHPLWPHPHALNRCISLVHARGLYIRRKRWLSNRRRTYTRNRSSSTRASPAVLEPPPTISSSTGSVSVCVRLVLMLSSGDRRTKNGRNGRGMYTLLACGGDYSVVAVFSICGMKWNGYIGPSPLILSRHPPLTGSRT